MKQEGKKKQRNFGKLFVILMFIFMGAICGFYSGVLLGKYAYENGVEASFPYFIWIGVLFLIAWYIHIIVHEGGHLIFGKLTGYQFNSFRIANFMFLKDNGKYKLKKFKLTGTGGQCLMIPPKEDEYNFPYILYNLGGIINNIILGLLCLLLYFILPVNIYLEMLLMLLFITGIAFGIINGIPVKLPSVANDGYNTLKLGQSREARHAFFIILQINARMTGGSRLRDMPEAWFEFSSDMNLENHLVCSIGSLRFSYLYDLKRYDEAEELGRFLLEDAPGMLNAQKNAIRCELLFQEITGPCREEEINRVYTKELKAYMKTASSTVSVRRLLYAYELLVNHNEGRADRQLTAFEKAAKTYPYQSEIESERELIEMVKERAAH